MRNAGSLERDDPQLPPARFPWAPAVALTSIAAFATLLYLYFTDFPFSFQSFPDAAAPRSAVDGSAAESRVDLERLRRTIAILSSYSSRVSGYPGADSAATWIEDQFHRVGLQSVTAMPFELPVPLDRPPAWAGWAAAGLFVIAALAGLALARNAIVDSWPGTVSIYDAVGLPIQAPHAQGLRIVDVESERVQEGDRTILLVRGLVENTTDKGRRLPPLRAVLADETGTELHEWPVAALLRVLDGGQLTAFESWLENPPEGAAKLSVDFVADSEE